MTIGDVNVPQNKTNTSNILGLNYENYYVFRTIMESLDCLKVTSGKIIVVFITRYLQLFMCKWQINLFLLKCIV